MRPKTPSPIAVPIITWNLKINLYFETFSCKTVDESIRNPSQMKNEANVE